MNDNELLQTVSLIDQLGIGERGRKRKRERECGEREVYITLDKGIQPLSCDILSLQLPSITIFKMNISSSYIYIG